MNSFDLDIPAVGVPSNLGMTAGAETMREVAALQEGSERADLRLTRVLAEPLELLRRLASRLTGRGATTDAMVSTKGWAMLS